MFDPQIYFGLYFFFLSFPFLCPFAFLSHLNWLPALQLDLTQNSWISSFPLDLAALGLCGMSWSPPSSIPSGLHPPRPCKFVFNFIFDLVCALAIS